MKQSDSVLFLSTALSLPIGGYSFVSIVGRTQQSHPTTFLLRQPFEQVGKTGTALPLSSNGDDGDKNNERRRNVDQAFVDLMEELKSDNEGGVNCKEDVSRESAREFVDRSFEFLTDLNRAFSTTAAEVEQNEKILGRQRQLVNKAVDYAIDLGQDMDDTIASMMEKKENPFTNVPSDLQTSVVDGSRNSDENAQPTSPIVPIVYTINENQESLVIEMELPGVSMTDIDLSLEQQQAEQKDTKNTVVVGALRRRSSSAAGGEVGDGKNGDVTASYSQKVALKSDPLLLLDQISANLDRGILRVVVPKEMPKDDNGDTNKTSRRRISVTSNDMK